MSTPDPSELESIGTTNSTEIQDSSANPSVTADPDSITEVSVNELKKKLEEKETPIIVDLRPKRSFDSGHIEHALSIPINELPSRYQELPDDQEIIVYSECA